MTVMQRKEAVFGVKASPTKTEGTFTAVVSVFGNIDYVGDRVLPGAFSASLKRWEASGDPIPVVFSHKWDDLDGHIGKVLKAEEREEGLWVKGQLDMEDEAARKVWRLMNDRRIREFSFAYNVLRERPGDDGANELVELDIIEVGPTLKGMNPATELLSVKSQKKGDTDLKSRMAALGATIGIKPTTAFDPRDWGQMPKKASTSSGKSAAQLATERVAELEHRLAEMKRLVDDRSADIRNMDVNDLYKAKAVGLLSKSVVDVELDRRRRDFTPPQQVRSLGYLQGGAVIGGEMPCLSPSCPQVVHLCDDPDGYCKDHKQSAPRLVMDENSNGYNWMNLDRELLDAQERLAKAQAAYETEQKAVAGLKQMIAEYDEKHRG